MEASDWHSYSFKADKCGEFTTSRDALADAVEKTGENITAKIIKERSKQIMNISNHDFSLYEWRLDLCLVEWEM